MIHIEKLTMELERLKEEYEALEGQWRMSQHIAPDDKVTLSRIKRHKLLVKERILEIEMLLYPDIIA